MDFDLTEEQQATVEVVEKLLADKATHEQLRAIEHDDPDRFDRDLWAAMADAGLLGLGLPEAAGGAGLGIVEIALVLEEVGRRTAYVPALPTMIGGHVLGRFGADPDLLAGVAEGRTVIGLAMADEGGDPYRPVATATATGDGWQVSGAKPAVWAGVAADTYLVTAMSGDTARVFLVEAGAAGLTVERQDTTSGIPEAALSLDGVRAMAVGPDDGSTVTALVDHATVGTCAVMAGVCDEAIRITGRYTIEREQFGRPIATFQAVGQRAADAYVDTQAVSLTMLQAAWRLGADRPAAHEVAVAKYWAALGGHRVTHAAQHLHGGIGVDRDYPVHRYFLWARQLGLSLGGANRQLRRLGQLLADA